MEITGIDHVTIYAADVEETTAFYDRVLDAEITRADDRPTTIQFDDVKINVHQAGDEYEPHADNPATGTADFCFTSDLPADAVADRLRTLDVEIVEGPVQRLGARGPMDSVYLRDPDGNLIEIAHYAWPSL